MDSNIHHNFIIMGSLGAQADMPYFKWIHIHEQGKQPPSKAHPGAQTFRQSPPELGLLSYLGGEQGPAVGRGAAAACAVAVVRHRPLQAPLGTARCRLSFMIFCRRRQKQRVFIEHAWCIHPYALWELARLSRCINLTGTWLLALMKVG